MKKDIFWNSLGTAAWSFLSLVLLVVVTRVNGVADSGLFSFSFALALIMFTIACYGVRTFQVSDQRNQFSADSYVSLRFVTILAAIALTVLFVMVNGYDTRKSILIYFLVAQRMFDAFSDVLYGMLQKNGLLHIAGKSQFYKSLVSLVAFCAVDLVTKDLLMASLTLPVVSLLFVLAYDVPNSRRVQTFTVSLRATETLHILRSIFLPFAVAAMGLVFANIARYFVDIYHPEQQGYFGIIVMPLSLIILLFSFVSTPAILHMSNLFNGKDYRGLHRIVGRIVGLTVGVTAVLLVLTFFLGAPLLRMLFKVEFAAYIPDVMLVVVIGLALSLTSLFTQVATIARKLRVAALIHLLTSVLLGVLCALLIEPYGVRGATIAYIAASFAQVLAMCGYYLQLTRAQSPSKKS